MKNQDNEFSKSIFSDFILSNEEMICVRGGDAEGDPITIIPPTKL